MHRTSVEGPYNAITISSGSCLLSNVSLATPMARSAVLPHQRRIPCGLVVLFWTWCAWETLQVHGWCDIRLGVRQRHASHEPRLASFPLRARQPGPSPPGGAGEGIKILGTRCLKAVGSPRLVFCSQRPALRVMERAGGAWVRTARAGQAAATAPTTEGTGGSREGRVVHARVEDM